MLLVSPPPLHLLPSDRGRTPATTADLTDIWLMHLAPLHQSFASVTCSRCHKVRHFAKVCRAAWVSSREVEPPEEVNIPEVTVLSTDCSALTNDKIMCTVKIHPEHSHACKVNLLVETGSSVSILPQSIFVQHLEGISLTQPPVKLVSYNCTSIPVLGCMSAAVFLYGNTAPGTFFIVDKGTPLMGRDLMKVLSVHSVNNQVLPL